MQIGIFKPETRSASRPDGRLLDDRIRSYSRPQRLSADNSALPAPAERQMAAEAIRIAAFIQRNAPGNLRRSR